ncbi:hypothetical protein QUF54_00360 [Candidatus Marithioploca araucensis]|uniref:Uncharacterized protein n=1 Tax=Candidatus Marithioploca araucensis TaxID=70273 RepID=A0ABT7VQ52_9GAMM|nr:hypothetical protein [Candidatus Marithioploca araucensis]
MESKAEALGVFWSPTLQLWAYFGIQSFSFGRILESNASALGVFWSPKLQLWAFFKNKLIKYEKFSDTCILAGDLSDCLRLSYF